MCLACSQVIHLPVGEQDCVPHCCPHPSDVLTSPVRKPWGDVLFPGTQGTPLRACFTSARRLGGIRFVSRTRLACSPTSEQENADVARRDAIAGALAAGVITDAPLHVSSSKYHHVPQSYAAGRDGALVVAARRGSSGVSASVRGAHLCRQWHPVLRRHGG